jgi:hypothetical protein
MTEHKISPEPPPTSISPLEKIIELTGLESTAEDSKIAELIMDINYELEAKYGAELLANVLGLNTLQKKDFNPVHNIYKTPKFHLPEDQVQQKELFVTFGKFLLEQYENAPEDEKAKRGENMFQFYANSMNFLYQNPTLELADKINGVHPNVRSEGPETITEDMTELIRRKAIDVVGEEKADEIVQEIDRVTQNTGFPFFQYFLENANGSEDIREVMQQVIEERVGDEALTIKKLQLVWQVEKYTKDFGLTLDTLYNVIGLPPSATLTTQLESLLKDTSANGALIASLPKDNGVPITNIWEILMKRAQRENFPNRFRTQDEVATQLDKMKKYFPLVFSNTTNNHVTTTLSPGSNPRSVAISWPQKDKSWFTAQVINPVLSKEELTKTLAHESTHGTQTILKQLAQKEGYYKEGTSPILDDTTDEALAEFIEQQFMQKAPDEQEGNSHTIDLNTTLETRTHALQALVQIDVRRRMEELWEKGEVTDMLSDEQAQKIINATNEKLEQWKALGAQITDPSKSILTFLNPTFPIDGLNYVLRHLKPDTDEPVEEHEENTQHSNEEKATSNWDQQINIAFIEKIGRKDWLEDARGRILWHLLLIETGRNNDITTYPDFIRNTNIDEAIQLFRRLKVHL